jgi:hypothetical protein
MRRTDTSVLGLTYRECLRCRKAGNPELAGGRFCSGHCAMAFGLLHAASIVAECPECGAWYLVGEHHAARCPNGSGGVTKRQVPLL